ncbi:16S rRNA (cytosine(967)-C(5))-methyltransferase RsmB [Alkalimonas collagenimarina]|uniref:16S rRNA (cytosine(967)-C(5))-methyltransferase n=1 Tax=Alkalimonas collagenimarina TaxID=400390 RepID=A0ABT9H1T0_9GAMM|nr:16S rRNA (cytosine(967)-C(5))-methyltransferase RsmB [Alkalimonas collagenimarina]MDP4537173.1 16S rRNA (cytosine(967)-C(5))-methyltransferase RsmB [Alkalimonas collagenimarina]
MPTNLRALAAQCCYQVVEQGRSLSDVLPKAQQQLADSKDQALLQEICFGVLRYLAQLDAICRQLMEKPLIKQLRPLQFLLYVGIYQLHWLRIPDHAAISETVEAARQLKGKSMTRLINGVLRTVQRRPELFQFEQQPDAVRYSHPGWLIKQLQQAYPADFADILQANQLKAPLWLRVNLQQVTVAGFTQALTEADVEWQQPLAELPEAILLSKAQDISSLPGYQAGWFAVQDAAAQFAAHLLEPADTHRILDACCAPGGKTCHLLERAPGASVLALDVDASRLERVHANLDRLQLQADVRAADASEPDSWWDGQLFDRILLDAPCSASGVIRRHPDIRWLRKASDIDALAAIQQRMLRQLWPLLKPGGILLYATCSVLPQENSTQLTQFLADTADAQLLPIQGKSQGWQILPGQQQMDGFFYAKVMKQPLAEKNL